MPILGISYKRNHTVRGLLWPTFFITRNVSKVHRVVAGYQLFIVFYGQNLHCMDTSCFHWIICQLMDIPVFSIFFCYWEYYCYEQSFTSYCENICFLFLLSICVDMELPGHMVNSILNFLRDCGTVSQRVAAPFYISTCNTLQSQFLHILANMCHDLFFFKPP